MKLMKYAFALAIALCTIPSASKAQTAFVGGGSSALALELGQAAVFFEDGVTGSCIWTRKTKSLQVGSTMNATDDRPGINKTESGDVWVVWGKGPAPGTCAAPNATAPGYNVYMYTNLDSGVGNRGFFMTKAAGVTGFVQNLVLVAGDSNPGVPDNILNKQPTAGHVFTDTVGGIPAVVIGNLNTQRWNWAGTDIRPEDALFANFRAEAACNSWIGRQPFDVILRYTQGLGYADGTVFSDDFGAGKTLKLYNFAINGALDPYSGIASPNFTALSVGAQPIIIAVGPINGPSGNGIYKNTDIPGFVAANFFSGVLGRASDLLGGSDNYGVTALVREPISGTYNTMEYGLVNNSQFHTSMDINNCVPGVAPPNPLHVVSANGVAMEGGAVQAFRRRVIGTGQMTTVLNSGVEAPNNPATQYIGFFFWGAGNISGLNNVKYLKVNGADPIQNAYTNGVLPGSGAPGDPCAGNITNPACAGTVTFAGLNNGDYPLWSALRVIYDPGKPLVAAAMTNLVAAAQNLTSVQYDFVKLSNLNVWRSHYYMNSINVNVAAMGPTLNTATPNDLCPGGLPEQGGDAGGAIISKVANAHFCSDFANNTGLVNKTE